MRWAPRQALGHCGEPQQSYPRPQEQPVHGDTVWTKQRVVRAEWPCRQGATGCHVRGGGGEAS